MDGDNKDCHCPNNYTKDVFLESFAVDEAELSKCNGCSHFKYSGGMCTCDLFNKEN